jgi:hypothetical protein
VLQDTNLFRVDLLQRHERLALVGTGQPSYLTNASDLAGRDVVENRLRVNQLSTHMDGIVRSPVASLDWNPVSPRHRVAKTDLR